jgi:sugar lactone lactonase YvrE
MKKIITLIFLHFYVFIFAQQITSFSPTSGCAGTIIHIYGTGFNQFSIPKFNANFLSPSITFATNKSSYISSTELTVEVGFESSGFICVVNPQRAGVPFSSTTMSQLGGFIYSGPSKSEAITGISNINPSQSAVVYSVPDIVNATSYKWTLPYGATGTSSTNSINVNYDSTAVSNLISVQGVNSCGVGEKTYIDITVNRPPSNRIIIGPMEVCRGQNTVIYTIPLVEYVKTYLWTLPSGATGVSSTNSISLNYGSTAVSGNITVQGKSDIGQSFVPLSTLSIIVTSSLPTVTPYGFSNTSTPCKGSKSTYSIWPIPNATSYQWTLPSGATGTSITNSIDVDFGLSAVSGNITVKGINACGEGTLSTSAISLVPLSSQPEPISGTKVVCQNQKDIVYSVAPIPNAIGYRWNVPIGQIDLYNLGNIINTQQLDLTKIPGNIEITVQGINSCGQVGPASAPFAITVIPLPSSAGIITGATTVNQGQNSVIYSVPAIENATSYQWTLPKYGVTGTSTTNNITLNYPFIYSFSPYSDEITVKGVNSCGVGLGSTLAITVNPSPPSAGIITGAITVCAGQNAVVYSVPANVNADSYQWTLPNGATGTSTRNSISVNYGPAAVSGNITVKGANRIGVGPASTLSITVNTFPLSAGVITGVSNVSKVNTVVYSVPAIANATTYEWILPNGAIGTSSTNSISVNFGLAAVSGNITVAGVNGCGVGVAATLAITVNPFGTIITKVPSISYVSPQTFALGKLISINPTNTGGPVPTTVYGQVSTLAGSGTSGASDGFGTSASFKLPFGVAVDATGNVYVGDFYNNKIRKISLLGAVTTLSGSGIAGATDGVGIAASFNHPSGVALDASGNIYVSDTGNNKIRKISPSGVVTTLAGSGTAGATDGVGIAASFNSPIGVSVNAAGNVYVADANSNKIRKISPSGAVTTLAGSLQGSTDGLGTEARFSNPYGVALDASGNVYVADANNNKIRKISPSGKVTTLAGIGTAGVTDGVGIEASFYLPFGIAVDIAGNLYVSNQFGGQIRKVCVTGYEINPITLPAGLSFDATTGIISGTPTAAFSATSYTVTAYNAVGSSSATIVISTSTLGLNEFSEGNIKLFPNPTHSVLNLSVNNGISLEKIIIVDTSGKVVLEQTENLSSINVEKLANGVYILTAYSEDKKYQEKFIKE